MRRTFGNESASVHARLCAEQQGCFLPQNLMSLESAILNFSFNLASSWTESAKLIGQSLHAQ